MQHQLQYRGQASEHAAHAHAGREAWAPVQRNHAVRSDQYQNLELYSTHQLCEVWSTVHGTPPADDGQLDGNLLVLDVNIFLCNASNAAGGFGSTLAPQRQLASAAGRGPVTGEGCLLDVQADADAGDDEGLLAPSSTPTAAGVTAAAAVAARRRQAPPPPPPPQVRYSSLADEDEYVDERDGEGDDDCGSGSSGEGADGGGGGAGGTRFGFGFGGEEEAAHPLSVVGPHGGHDGEDGGEGEGAGEGGGDDGAFAWCASRRATIRGFCPEAPGADGADGDVETAAVAAAEPWSGGGGGCAVRPGAARFLSAVAGAYSLRLFSLRGGAPLDAALALLDPDGRLLARRSTRVATSRHPPTAAAAAAVAAVGGPLLPPGLCPRFHAEGDAVVSGKLPAAGLAQPPAAVTGSTTTAAAPATETTAPPSPSHATSVVATVARVGDRMLLTVSRRTAAGAVTGRLVEALPYHPGSAVQYDNVLDHLASLLHAGEALALGGQLGELLARQQRRSTPVPPPPLSPEAAAEEAEVLASLLDRAWAAAVAVSRPRLRSLAEEVVRRYADPRVGPVHGLIGELLAEACGHGAGGGGGCNVAPPDV
ncbi:hypothetical protein GPECTOR_154g70 [Gonium pectorale]|uniref:Uncharacterized protein n=1 Tax=Gonium pectorale TaxID=33097 RepID=A0A150FXP8_GONPE|nr:hypothetical protein GPECTOR_154g70 [Gonium pectorale]|eukprot:KXZ42379.1 hypothetical protein GPECTOR_154g70 [Gonium pectorale]